MPEESVLKINKINETYWSIVRKIIISPIGKLLWLLIPQAVFLGKLRRICVELSSICNANCVFCAYQFFPKNRVKKFVPENIFKQVVQEVKAAKIQEIMLSPDLGEPTLVPGFIDKIEAFRVAGVQKIALTTNAIVLHKIGIDAFLERGPDVINISTTGFDEAMFRRIYRCQGYETMRENVIELLEKNSRLAFPREINIKLRSDIPVKKVRSLPEMGIITSLANDVRWMTTVDSWNGRIKQKMLPGILHIQTLRNKLSRRPCGILLSIVIRVDGGVHACSCRNIGNDPDLFLGNLVEQGLLACYRKLEDVIKNWKQGKIPGVCKTCDMYNDPSAHMVSYVRAFFKDFVKQTGVGL